MSKNVAVFVDVANVFYAAKAAGVDIDYVQMLKTATAGRDLVRAYAYTGLDPENENQRQFHSFLARHGYKVVSKDIRKYGDGKTKANLDIELVVDLMRTSHNLDIAVVVSGDGDFAPAIRAVQDQGVRVEVISFRANTSSDLIEVADLFTDITQIAKVEKGSSRSGRRVASEEDDLSMTAVPEKESDGTGRRRRGSRGRGGERSAREGVRVTRDSERAPRDSERAPRDSERVPVAAEVASVSREGLVALPGERLSRAPRGAPTPAVETEGQAGAPAAEGEEHEEDAEGGRRRRRRRGGRGRGRSHEPESLVEAAAPADEEEPEPIGFEAPRTPQHSAFGSVWDSQLGMTPTNLPAGEPLDFEDEDEPEIPEYLLSERRQRGGRSRGPGQVGQAGRRQRGRGAYQSALDRERFGTGRNALPTPAYDGRRSNRSSSPGRSAGDRSFGSRTGGQPARSAPEERAFAPSGGQPWSEVPPELEEQLRAELARKRASEPREAAPTPAETSRSTEATAPATPRRPTRSRKAVSAGAEPAATETEAKPTRTTRTRRPAAAATTAGPSDETAGTETAAKPTRTTRTRRPTAAAITAAATDDATEAAPKPRRTTRGRKATDTAPTEA
ncbi:MAG TPA: NYN domain-containing protein [Candidatus Limnocylindrales bacterium]|nr:NYN domain-containing protein [Candidatus Limnocylindrales bacterium]